MPNAKPIITRNASTKPAGWHSSHGTYIAGQAEIDDLDIVAKAMETKWGCDRLRLLVPVELREKFDRQRYLTNQAIWHGSLEDVRAQARRMITAWRALDRQAGAAGAAPLSPAVWEFAMEDGAVGAIVRDIASARSVAAEGRFVRVFSLDEVARMLAAFPELSRAKIVFPGATIERVRTHIGDPLDAIDDTCAPIDDPIPF